MRNTIKIDGNCKLIAHRGSSCVERENSLPAFVAAGNRSYFGIETDIHPTLDGKFVILHDCNTSRVSDQSIEVEKCTYNELSKIRLNDLDGRPRSDLCLPLLEDYLRICKAYGKHCVIEFKGIYSRQNIEKVIQLVQEEYSLNNVTFIAFDIENLIILREILPEVSLQYLTVEINDDIFSKLIKYNLGLDVLCTVLTKEWIEKLHLSDIEVNCWTVDLKEEAEQLISWGVDYITSNRLE